MSLPSQARVIEISAPGDAEVLKPAMRPVPVARGHDILIAVRAAGVNRPDVYQRMGQYDPPPGASDLPGLEAAGVVAAVGEAVTRWKVGDAVTALLPGGGYAEYALTHEDHALRVPASSGRSRASENSTHATASRCSAGATASVFGLRGYLTAIAFAGEPTPPTRFSGLTVRRHSQTPSRAQSSASSSSAHCSPMTTPSSAIKLECIMPQWRGWTPSFSVSSREKAVPMIGG